jgi:GAF domain-containing protein
MEPYLRRDQASSGLSAPASSASKALFPAGDRGNTVAEMARRDLDAALQLLANRAQYITGATGAAIALRRDGKNDMLCRASTGSTAPELGALLSTEFGLSGESVRTRQALRCDDAERDVRVNREVCRQLGIASVVVMPVVNDDGVLGVFELFSGQVNAFGERDLSAVQRLSVMVETAVRLAEAAEHLPERLKAAELSVPAIDTGEAEEDGVLEGPELVSGDLLAEALNLDDLVLDEVFVKEPESAPSVYSPAIEALVKPLAGGTQEHLTQTPTPPQAEQVGVTMGAVVAAPADSKLVVAEKASPSPELKTVIAENVPATTEPKPLAAESIVPGPVETKAAAPENAAAAMDAPEAITPETISLPASPAAQIGPAPSEIVPTKKPTFWSAEPNPAGETGAAEEADRSHVPPGLRGLRKCEACRFPISAGRVLCVECEEKKWRGQLRVPSGGRARQAATASAAPAALPKEGRAFAAAQTAAASGAASLPRGASVTAAGDTAPVAVNEASAITVRPLAAVRGANPSALPEPLKPAEQTGKSSSDFVFSAGIATSQSWFLSNKYVIAAVLLVAAVAVTAVFLLR